jgi:hypothetical protein
MGGEVYPGGYLLATEDALDPETGGGCVQVFLYRRFTALLSNSVSCRLQLKRAAYMSANAPQWGVGDCERVQGLFAEVGARLGSLLRKFKWLGRWMLFIPVNHGLNPS